MTDQTGSWQPDPSDRHQYRYWNGTTWTDQVSDDGTVASDRYDAPPAPPAPLAPTSPGVAPFAPPVGAAYPGAAPTGGGRGSKLPLVIGGITLLALVVVGAVVFLGSRQKGDPDELAALLVADGAFSGDQAACLGDELSDDLSVDRLAELLGGAARTAGEEQAFLTATVECGVFGDTDSDSIASEEGDDYGDNPTLDALWDACAGSDGLACDNLYLQSEVGSRYEEFGDTCGDRFPAGTVVCAEQELG